MAHAFTVHPYRWPTIGWMEDIRALALPDIRAFYRHVVRAEQRDDRVRRRLRRRSSCAS